MGERLQLKIKHAPASLNLYALPRQLVELPPVLFLRRIHGGDLVDFTPQLLQGRFNLLRAPGPG